MSAEEAAEGGKFYHLYCDAIYQRDEARRERDFYKAALEFIRDRAEGADQMHSAAEAALHPSAEGGGQK